MRLSSSHPTRQQEVIAIFVKRWFWPLLLRKSNIKIVLKHAKQPIPFQWNFHDLPKVTNGLRDTQNISVSTWASWKLQLSKSQSSVWSSPLNRRKLHIKLSLWPETPDLLLVPFSALRHQLQIKLPKKSSQNKTHLSIGEAVKDQYFQIKHESTDVIQKPTSCQYSFLDQWKMGWEPILHPTCTSGLLLAASAQERTAAGHGNSCRCSMMTVARPRQMPSWTSRSVDIIRWALSRSLWWTSPRGDTYSFRNPIAINEFAARRRKSRKADWNRRI